MTSDHLEHFGRYRIIRHLATGGMGEVLLAQTAWLDGFAKDVVLKRVRPEYCKDPNFVSMFLDEARLSIQLDHPNVVQVFDFGEYDGQHFLAMEYVSGSDVNTLIRHPRVVRRGMDVPATLFITSEVCQALDYAHNKTDRAGLPLNIVHRDVTPQNIFVSELGVVKVGDFGIAKARTSVRESQPGELVGNLSYMAPEAVEGEAEPRSDLFSAGLVLREMLLGVPTYSAQNPIELATLAMQALIAPASNFRGDVPRSVDDLLDKLLSKAPAARFQSARELGETIHDILTAEYPKFNQFAFRGYLEELRRDLSEHDVASAPTPFLLQDQSRPARTAPVRMSAVDFDWTPELVQAVENFRRAPDLWQLVTIGDVCRQAGEATSAASAYRVAGHKFAQAGLLGPALLAARLMIHSLPDADLDREISNFTEVVGQDDAAVNPLLFRRPGPLEDLLKELLEEVRLRREPSAVRTPMLSMLPGEAFYRLAKHARLRRIDVDDKLITQDQNDRNMYLIARGRVLVYYEGEGKKTYLACLSTGDFVGENGFFTGAPRSATVEAIYPTDVFVIDPDVYRQTIPDGSLASDVLLQFYKERIVDTMMARSDVFGVLSAEDRRALLELFYLRTFDAGERIITEGERSDDIYVIKNGTARVFTGAKTLATLKPGTLFGEIAAFRGVPRTASVEASTELETLVAERAALRAIIDVKPEVAKRIQAVISDRVRSNLDQIMGRFGFPSA